jgi:NAD-dependent dihydropyrimidine dehydrogenase PreA subunit
MSADTVILAIGQTNDLSWLRPEDHITITKSGTIEVDPESLATTAPGIYSGGDVAFGPRIAISAIADGRRAGSSMDAYLRGTSLVSSPIEIDIQLLSGFTREHDFEAVARQKPPVLPIDRRVGIAEIETCFPEDIARLEASRCFRCWINTIFEEDSALGTECILCGGCADVCPENCIEFIPTSDLLVGPELRADVVSEFGEAADVLLDEEVEGAVLLKDETVCIRCGLCARRCPAGTITMQAFQIKEYSGG